MNGHLSKIKKKFLIVIHGGIFFEILGRYCMAIALSCVRITLFNFIARGLRVRYALPRKFLKFWMHSRVYFDIIM